MTIIVASIVEGDGEVGALPVVLRRLNAELSPQVQTEIVKPIRVRRDRFLNREDEFSKYIRLAHSSISHLAQHQGWIIILLDADDDCPAKRSREILNAASKIVPAARISVVMANREFESWFIASATSLNGRRGLIFNTANTPDSETIRNAKGWLTSHMPQGSYREVTDQPALSSLIDIGLTRRNSRSFEKLCREWEKKVNYSS